MLNLQELIARNALFVMSHSGGKDSQAATIEVQKLVPADRLVLVHAELPEADWDGIENHIKTSHPGLPLVTCQAVWADGRGKTFLDMVASRGFWPSPTQRQCTSDLKRTPIEVVVRRLAKQYGTNLVVVIDGRRADESTDRAKLATWSKNNRLSKAGREVYDWLPIHQMTEARVFATIAAAGQKPHWAYSEGMSRLSCCFCVMAKKSDLQTAARLKPALFARYVAMERQINQTFAMPKKNGERLWLTDIVGQVQAETDELALAA